MGGPWRDRAGGSARSARGHDADEPSTGSAEPGRPPAAGRLKSLNAGEHGADVRELRQTYGL